MLTFSIISFNHKKLSLEHLGLLHLNEDRQNDFLGNLKSKFGFEEVMMLSTCNRVEIYLFGEKQLNDVLISSILNLLNNQLTSDHIHEFTNSSVLFESDLAVKHVFEVASSLNSLVVGEREIITQVRKAYEFCNLHALTGDFIRILIKQTIETAKDVFTKTDIAKNPVSIVSLAYRQLRELGIKNDARIIMIGAGETNLSMANYLQKHKYANFTLFNRTLATAQVLADKLQGKAFSINELSNYSLGFDVLITCTGSTTPIINQGVYRKLIGKDTSKKVIIDLALPADVEQEVRENNSIHYIDINSLKNQAENNLKLREKEIEKCDALIENRLIEFRELYKERKIELAFGEIPRQVKAIKEFAVNEVFVKEINSLDDKSKDVLEKVLTYVEKKYNAVAMKTAKEALLSKEN